MANRGMPTRNTAQSSLIITLLCLLGILLLSAAAGATMECSDVERDALLAFKTGIVSDPARRLSSWHRHVDCCRWSGVVCHNTTGHVLKLNLQNPNHDYFERDQTAMRGKFLSPSLLSLTHLRRLDLSHNDFGGIRIPDFVGSFPNLRHLDLSYSNFTGTYPPQLGNLSTLRHLGLAMYADTARVDHLRWLSRLTSLTYLDLTAVDLSKASHHWLSAVNMLPLLRELHLTACGLRSIPSSLPYVNLTALTILDLRYNNFNSTIPNWLSELSSLTYLDLLGNLDLRADGLEWLSRLSSLTYLDLTGVDLSKASHDWLPAVNMLPTLQELHLSFSGLSSIPSSLPYVNLTTLTTLDLSGNNFNSTFPSWLWELSSLSYLHLGYSGFYGAIPAAIGNLTSLNFLVLAGSMDELTTSESTDAYLDFNSLVPSPYRILNSLTGPLPADIGKLSNLVHIDLSFNFLEGEVSQLHFTNLTRLETLSLSHNPLTIAIDDNWNPPFQLEYIRLHSCRVGPRFPGWLRWQRSIVELDLSNTSIADTLPNWLWNSSVRIGALDISQNQISGTLPASLEGMTMLSILSVGSNLLQGPVPALPSSIEILDMSSNSLSGPVLPPTLLAPYLTFLLLSDNQISGSMPSYLCDLTYLDYLDLSNNKISGEIPQCWKSELSFVSLANNKLSGGIPSSLATFSTVFLNLNRNKLSGKLPPSLQNCSKLAILDVGENKLSGSIPAWIGESLQYLAIIRLRSNKFSGNVPSQLGQLRQLQILDLADNQLSGPIPHSFGNFRAMISTSEFMDVPSGGLLPAFVRFIARFDQNISIVSKGQTLGYSTTLRFVKSIDISSNGLTGEIPDELGRLLAVQTLNLSRNDLEGRIPEAIGRMQSLETLDLSFNELSGAIPQSLSALSSLSHLNVSYNNLSGRIPSGDQLQTLDDPYIYVGNAHLCGAPTSKSCSPVVVVVGEEEPGDGSKVAWLYLSVVLGFVVGLWGVFVVLLYHRAWRFYYFRMIDDTYDKLYVAVAIYLAKRRNRG